jgi:hypothetical protein
MSFMLGRARIRVPGFASLCVPYGTRFTGAKKPEIRNELGKNWNRVWGGQNEALKQPRALQSPWPTETLNN